MQDRLNVGFICVHNSCRSQMAEAIAKVKYSHLFNAYSAGSEMSRSINADAIRHIKDRYNVDMTESQKPKLIETLKPLDVSITMGCDVVCPVVENQHTEDWNLDDPSGKSDEFFISIIEEIEDKLAKLAKRIENNEI